MLSVEPPVARSSLTGETTSPSLLPFLPAFDPEQGEIGSAQSAARLACSLVDVTSSAVVISSESQYRVLASTGLEASTADRLSPPLEASCAEVLAADRAYALTDPQSHAWSCEAEYLSLAFAGVPLHTSKGERIGVLFVTAEAPRQWSEKDLGTLVDLARVTAPALEQRASESLQEVMAQHIPEVFYVLDRASRRVLHASSAFESIWGRAFETANAAELSLWPTAVHPEDLARVVDAFERQARGEAILEEYRVIRPDGSIRWIRDRAFPLEARDGTPAHTIGIAEDITARKWAEEKLIGREEYFRALVERTAHVVSVLDADGTILYKSPSVQDLTEYSDKALVGRNLLELVHVDDLEVVRDALVSLAVTPEASISLEFRLLRRNGGVVHVEGSGSNLLGHPAVQGIVFNVREVSASTRTAVARRDVEARYRDFFENTSDLIYSYDLQGRFTSVNGSFERATGYPRAELLNGMSIGDLMDPEDAQHLLRQAMREEGELGYEISVRTKKGKRIWLEVTSHLESSAGQIVGVQQIARDVTERKQAEAALQLLAESGSLLSASLDVREALEQVADLTARDFADWCVLNLVGTHGNLQRVRVASQDPRKAELVEQLERLYPTDPAQPRLSQRVLETGKPVLLSKISPADIDEHARDEKHARLLRELGTRSAMIIPLSAHDKTWGVMSLISTDPERSYRLADLELAMELGRRAGLAIDNALQHQAALDARVRYRDLFRSNPVPSWVYDRERHRILNVNDAAVEHYGYSREEFLSMTMEDLVPSGEASRFRECLQDDDGARLQDAQWRHRKKDGAEIDVELTCCDVEIEGVLGRIVLATDVTERNKVEETLRRAKEQAEAANMAKSRFMANMSHELRTPLNSILGFAGILQKSVAGAPDPKQAQYLTRITANGEHLLALINDILDLSKVEVGRLELEVIPTSLEVLVQETLYQLGGRLEGRPVTLHTEIPERIGLMHADGIRLRQILINLIGNAIKFTERGAITVRVHTDPENDRPTQIEVEDTGIGIPEDQLESIFEAFEQVDGAATRQYEGTGLGLAISRALARQMGFDLEVESDLGRGSTFRILLNPAEKT